MKEACTRSGRSPGQGCINGLQRRGLERHNLAHAVRLGKPFRLAQALLPEIPG
jgi:hypothetical protein